MKVVFLAKQNPFLIGWIEVKEGEEFDCPECLARHKVADGKIVRVVCEYDEPCPHTSWGEEDDGTLKVYFTRHKEEGELAKQGDYSDYVNLRQLGLTPGQLGRMIGLVDWIRKVFPQVLEELKEAEKLMNEMRSGDQSKDARARVIVQNARIKIEVLLKDIDKYAPQSE
jgi:hypothetical protein